MSIDVEEAKEYVLANWERDEETHQDMSTDENTSVIKPQPLHCLENLSFQQQITSIEAVQNIAIQCAQEKAIFRFLSNAIHVLTMHVTTKRNGKDNLIHKKSQWLCLKNLIQFLNLGKIFDELIYKA